MRFDRFRLQCLSSFEDSGWINLEKGINLLIGQNNTGKTAIAKAFGIGIGGNQHRNKAEFRSGRISPPSVEMDLIIGGEELRDIWLSAGTQVHWPVAANGSPDSDLEAFLGQEIIVLEFVRKDNSEFYARNHPFHKRFVGSVDNTVVIQNLNGKLRFVAPSPNPSGTLTTLLGPVWTNSVFTFDAQRFSIGTCASDQPARLSANAHNLAAVLANLQGGRPTHFKRLNEHVREIFSTVQSITVVPVNPNQQEIRVWPTDDRSNVELSASLNDCGTGVSQVLAILAVAITLDQAVIVIDELSSFLHPAATKSLIRILQTYYSNHQYIITTHSSDVMSVARPSTVYLVEKIDFKSTVKPIDVSKFENLRLIAGQLGISTSDVFGADKLIWVEGPTEEACFRYILAENLDKFDREVGPLGSMPLFLAVHAPSDFASKSKKADLVFALYQKLSAATLNLVKSTTFSFDREGLTDRQISDLLRYSKKRALFLERRMIECYLLDPAAIAAVINGQLSENPITEADVFGYLMAQGGDLKFKAHELWKGNISDGRWLEKVDAASLLAALFQEVTNSRANFQKTRDCIEILKLSLANNRPSVVGLIKYVMDLVKLATIDDSSELPSPT